MMSHYGRTMNHASPKHSILTLVLIFLGVGLLIGLDQWTKQLAETLLVPGQIVPVLTLGGLGDICYLLLTRNSGAFLSLGANLTGLPHTLAMVAVPVLALLAILFALLQELWNKKAKPLDLSIKIALGLILAGGSNILDRLVHGEVTDFLNFGIMNLRTGIMNIADLYIMAAMITLAVYVLRKRPMAPTKPDNT